MIGETVYVKQERTAWRNYCKPMRTNDVRVWGFEVLVSIYSWFSGLGNCGIVIICPWMDVLGPFSLGSPVHPSTSFLHPKFNGTTYSMHFISQHFHDPHMYGWVRANLEEEQGIWPGFWSLIGFWVSILSTEDVKEKKKHKRANNKLG